MYIFSFCSIKLKQHILQSFHTLEILEYFQDFCFICTSNRKILLMFELWILKIQTYRSNRLFILHFNLTKIFLYINLGRSNTDFMHNFLHDDLIILHYIKKTA